MKNKPLLAALFSGGKDSCYAVYLMKNKGYSVECLISIKSKNPDSYMFHTPNIHLVELQAKAMQIPLLSHETNGEKEKELKDLKEAILKAKRQYKIEGIITGALFSNYQRERIEKICSELNLEVFSPLWQMDPEREIREILGAGFKFIIAKIAADGLDESWLGREISQKDVDKLVELNKKTGISIAFEGGEAESLVVGGPLFKSKIKIISAEKVMENKCTGVYSIKEAGLKTN